MDTIQPIITAITAEITVEQVVTVVAAAAGIAVGFAFAWWAARKVTRMIMSGFKRGRISV